MSGRERELPTCAAELHAQRTEDVGRTEAGWSPLLKIGDSIIDAIMQMTML